MYQKGEWARARKLFRQVESIKKGLDTPTQVILDFMAKTNYVAPEDWKGYRYQDDDWGS